MRGRAWAIGTLIAVMGAVALPTTMTSAGAVVPGANGRIAFESDRDGRFDIYAMDANGANVTDLTNTPDADEYEAVWSPDGQRIAYSREDDQGVDLWVMDADGGNQTKLTLGPNGAGGATWSPDGAKIAFLTGGGVSTMDADGANIVPLVTDGSPGQIRWSPDGELVSMTQFYADTDTREVAVVPAVGGPVQRLTHHAAGAGAERPSWSPDGTKIGYTQYGPKPGFAVVNRDGTGDARITLDLGHSGTWSPDGTMGAYAGNDAEIYTTTTDFAVRTNITNDGSLNDEPDWQPIVSPCEAQRSGKWIGSWSQPSDNVSGAIESLTTNGGDTITGNVTFVSGTTLLLGNEAISGTITCNRMTGTVGPVTLVGALLNDGREMGGTYSYPPPAPGYSGGSGFWHSSLVTATATGNGTATTDTGGGATPASPIQATIASPVAGALTIDSATSSAPGYIAGYQLAGQLVRIDVPTATANAPLKLTFDVDASVLGGRSPATLSLFRNGIFVSDCGSKTVATPDPCVLSRTLLPTGDVRVVVLTSKASVWEVGLPTAKNTISIGDGSVVEGHVGTKRVISFPVTLSEPAHTTVTVPYLIESDAGPNPATPRTDFVAKSGKVVFKPSAKTGLTPTTVSVSASIVGDGAQESDETMRVQLLTPTTGTFDLAKAGGVGTIIDDDNLPTLAAVGG